MKSHSKFSNLNFFHSGGIYCTIFWSSFIKKDIAQVLRDVQVSHGNIENRRDNIGECLKWDAEILAQFFKELKGFHLYSTIELRKQALYIEDARTDILNELRRLMNSNHSVSTIIAFLGYGTSEGGFLIAFDDGTPNYLFVDDILTLWEERQNRTSQHLFMFLDFPYSHIWIQGLKIRNLNTVSIQATHFWNCKESDVLLLGLLTNNWLFANGCKQVVFLNNNQTIQSKKITVKQKPYWSGDANFVKNTFDLKCFFNSFSEIEVTQKSHIEFSNSYNVRYEGDWKVQQGNLIPDGNGKIFNINKNLIYDGPWTFGKLAHPFTTRNLNSGTYSGFFVNDLLEGEGKINKNDEIVIQGNFLHNKLHGYGKIVLPIGLIEGNFENGRLIQGVKKSKANTTYKGIFQKFKLCGEGQISHPNGERRSGMFDNDRLCGPGKVEFPSGEVWVGQFQNDLLHGRATKSFPDGSTFDGDFEHGKLSGFGKVVKSGGVIEEGHFANDLLHGEGKRVVPWVKTLEGTFLHGEFTGYGLITYVSGGSCQGYFLNEKMDGCGKWSFGKASKVGCFLEDELIEGTFLDFDHTQYSGNFTKSKLTKGKITFHTGEVWQGTFNGGLLHGNGSKSFPSGIICEGKFINGKFSGIGSLVKQAGILEIGTFWDDNLQGKGKRISSDESHLEGRFIDGELNGRGKIFEKSTGTLKIGRFNRNALQGMGRILKHDGSISVGIFKDSKLDGPGLFHAPNGTYSFGIFSKGELSDGCGKIIKKLHILSGQFMSSELNGIGKRIICKTASFVEEIIKQRNVVPTLVQSIDHFDFFANGFNPNLAFRASQLVINKTNKQLFTEIQEGNFHADRFTGKGGIIWPGGSYLIGQFLNGNMLHGKGFLCHKGLIITGQISNNMLNGKGKLCFQNGDLHEGYFTNNVLNGEGKLVYQTGEMAKGIFKNGLFTGEGTLKKSDSQTIEKGLFKDNVLNGFGEMVCSSGSKYIGTFVEGQLKNGKIIESCGKTYKGDFLNNKLNGEGKIKFPGGVLWKGTFSNNLLDGIGHKNLGNGFYQKGLFSNGILIEGREKSSISGYKIDGEILNGKIHGNGVCSFPNGETWEGQFSYGLLNGKGIKTYPIGGLKCDGVFVNGLFNGNGMRPGRNSKSIESGTFLNDKLNGPGCVYFFNTTDFVGPVCRSKFDYCQDMFHDYIEKWSGNFVEGVLNGENCVIEKKNHSLKKGHFIDGMLHGIGQILMKNETNYTGNFARDQLNGKGEIKFKNGDFLVGDFDFGSFIKGDSRVTTNSRIIEGQMKGCKLDGQGKISFLETQETWEGVFKDNILNGEGRKTMADGRFCKGIFKNGLLTGVGSLHKSRESIIETGNFINDKLTDINGTREYQNGDVWQGSFAKGVFTGFGKIIKSEGSIYKGEFKNALLNGKGTVLLKDNTIMEGDFVNNSICGTGSIKWPDGFYRSGRFGGGVFISGNAKMKINKNIYEGYFDKGKLNGQGSITFSNGSKWEGEFTENILNGKGKKTNADGTWLEGVFKYGVCTGFGTIKKDTEMVIEFGNFVNEILHGKGSRTHLSGEIWKGTFNMGTLEGEGSITTTNGIKYKGHFVNNHLNGKGSIKYPNGQHLSGDFLDNVLHGSGSIQQPNGFYRIGEFVNGEFISGKAKMTIDNKLYEGQIENQLPNGIGFIIFQNENLWSESLKKYILSGKFEENPGNEIKLPKPTKNSEFTGFDVFEKPGQNLVETCEFIWKKLFGEEVQKLPTDEFLEWHSTFDKSARKESEQEPNLDIHAGVFKNKKIKNEESITCHKETIIRGHLEDEDLHGMGEIELKNCFFEIGKFANGQLVEGKVKKTIDGYLYQGYLKNGRLCGQGSIEFCSGEKLYGQFEDNLLNGKGVIFQRDGSKEEGIFRNGKLNGKGRMTIVKQKMTNHPTINLCHLTESSRNVDVFEGEFQDGELHGKGQVLLRDGTKKCGQFKHNVIFGQGDITYENGDSKTGVFHNEYDFVGVLKLADKTKKEGHIINSMLGGDGEIRYPNGDVYSGKFLFDQLNGQGVKKMVNGITETGVFIGNKLYGRGNVIGPEFELDGIFQNGILHGMGTKKVKNETYKGMFINDKLNGEGYKEVNNVKYEGKFKDDDFVGPGEISGNAFLFSGHFLNGKLHGHGKKIIGNDLYEGTFQHGELSGQGRKIFNGITYEGMFENDKLNGKGMIIDNNGNVTTGEFQNDVCINKDN